MTFNLDLSLDLSAVSFFQHDARPTHRFLARRNGNSRDDFLDGLSPQYSSELDGLGQMRSPQFGFYNWTPDAEVEGEQGHLSMEHFARHGIVGRGVLLDVARHLATPGTCSRRTRGASCQPACWTRWPPPRSPGEKGRLPRTPALTLGQTPKTSP